MGEEKFKFLYSVPNFDESDSDSGSDSSDELPKGKIRNPKTGKLVDKKGKLGK